MDSSREHALEALTEWEAAGRTVAIRVTSGQNWLAGNGTVDGVNASVLQLGGNGFEVRFDLSSAAFDWRPGDKSFEPLLRIRALGYDCVLFPLKEVKAD